MYLEGPGSSTRRHETATIPRRCVAWRIVEECGACNSTVCIPTSFLNCMQVTGKKDQVNEEKINGNEKKGEEKVW